MLPIGIHTISIVEVVTDVVQQSDVHAKRAAFWVVRLHRVNFAVDKIHNETYLTRLEYLTTACLAHKMDILTQAEGIPVQQTFSWN